MNKNLWDVAQGEKCSLKGFDESLGEEFQQRLADLGFYPGQLVKCVMSPKFGAPKLFQVNNAVYSLDDKIARHIVTE